MPKKKGVVIKFKNGGVYHIVECGSVAIELGCNERTGTMTCGLSPNRSLISAISERLDHLDAQGVKYKVRGYGDDVNAFIRCRSCAKYHQQKKDRQEMTEEELRKKALKKSIKYARSLWDKSYGYDLARCYDDHDMMEAYYGGYMQAWKDFKRQHKKDIEK